MADSYRWRLSGQRDRLLEVLVDVTDEKTKAKALEELLATADERGSLTAAEIAEILATDELPVEYEPATWAVGVVDD